MLFHTPAFLLFFVVFVAVWLPLRDRRAGRLVVLVASSVFYAAWDWRFLGLIWFTIALDYTLSHRLERTSGLRSRRALVAISLLANLSILGFFKYWNFFVRSVGSVAGETTNTWLVPGLILPVGISFYTFQSMSYILDVYRGRQAAVRSLVDYAAFVSYFPQLVAGPIERLHRLLPQIIQPAPITGPRVVSGVFLFTVGFARKAVGDLLGAMHDPVFADLAAATPHAVVGSIISFGLQIYLDFAGYTDMARGVSRVLGIELILNFRAPYFARSVREFWRRWHVSLSQWLRDYVYVSLGGSRRSFPRHLANLMVTMLLGGLWHGAGWNFLIWGGLHGVYLSINTLWSRAAGGATIARPSRRVAAHAMSWTLTLLAVTYAWLYFRIPTFDDAVIANQKILAWMLNPTVGWVSPTLALVLGPMLALDVWQYRREEFVPYDGELTWAQTAVPGVVAGLLWLLGLILLIGQPTQQFIYFQF